MRVSKLLAVTLSMAGMAALTIGTSAAAAPHFVTVPSVQLGYTDSATPRTAYDWAQGVDMPLGAHVDAAGKVHKSRVYATFNVTQFFGKRVIDGTLRIRESVVADCTKRAIEVWQTKAIHRTPSWDKAPRAEAKLDEILTVGFCPATLTFDVGPAIAEAVRKGKDRVTFEFRVPKWLERDPSYGRMLSWFTSVGLTVQYNSVPTIDDMHMYHAGRHCAPGSDPLHISFFSALQGMAADADENDQRNLSTEFAVWPQDDPSARRIYTSDFAFVGRVSGIDVPVSDLEEGRAYSWQYRSGDGADFTPWSRTCDFVADRTRPADPAVTSSNYPRSDTGEGTPLGEPGVFTFSGGGDPDVIGFEWGFNELGVPGCGFRSGPVGQHECGDPLDGPNAVAADVPGGTATALINPQHVATNRLLVRSIDRAGNRSFAAEYEFFAPWNGDPIITVVGPEPEWNQQVTLRFTMAEGITGTTSYVYKLDNEPAQTIAPEPDGSATITFLASSEFGHQVRVRSFSGNGWVSTEGAYFLTFVPWPTVRSDVYLSDGEPHGGVGVPGTFTFSKPAGWTEVKGYQYSLNGGEYVFIAAGPDGRASIVFTPEASGDNYFDVYAVRPNDTWSDYSNFYWFLVS